MVKKSNRSQMLQKAREVLKNHKKRLMSRKGVQGCDIGYRVDKDGNLTNKIVIRIHVHDKIPIDALDPRRALDDLIEGVPVQVLERKYRQTDANDRSKHFRNPILGGVAIAPKNNPSVWGSLGVVVFDKGSKEPRYLTNAHVIPQSANIIQPPDSSTVPAGEQAQIGRTSQRRISNFVDCGLVKPSGRSSVRDIIGIKGPFILGELTDDDFLNRTKVVKSGAKSKRTTGVVDNIQARVDIPGGGTFIEQITVRGKNGKRFLEPGDSGSCLIREGTKEIVGLLHASTEDGIGVACDFGRVLRALNVVLDP